MVLHGARSPFVTATTCARCAAELPTVPPDIHRSNLCAACAAAPAPPSSASSPWAGPGPGHGWGTPPAASATPTLVVRRRIGEGLVVGLAAAALAGLGWWASVFYTERLFPYVAIVVGILVGQGVLIGARKGGAVPAVLAGLLTITALLTAQYFIERSLAIANFDADIPLWLGFDTARQIVTDSFDADRLLGLFWLVSVIAAAISAGSPSRRPVV